MPLLKVAFWGSLGALAWTHVGYPLAAAAAARVRTRPVRRDPDCEPSVTVIVPAYNEEAVIERRLENLLALDYPVEKLGIVVASDASSDRTNELVEAVAAREPRVSLLDCPRGGKVAAQDRAVRQATSDVVAFSDGNSTWSPDALRHLVANLADPEVAYVCGQLRLEDAVGGEPGGHLLALRDDASRRGVAARLDHRRQRLHLRGQARRLRRGRPALGSRPLVSLPDGAGGAARRLRARRARLREADAVERDRVPPQGAHVRALLGDHAARLDVPPPSARLPRRDRLAPAAPLRQRRSSISRCSPRASLSPATAARTGSCSRARSALLAAAAAGVPIARYYTLVTWATVVALWNYLRRGVPATWEAAEGTR